jgi:hypothetical protein
MSPFRLALLILAVLLFLVAALVPLSPSQPRVSLVPLGLAAFAGAFIVP